MDMCSMYKYVYIIYYRNTYMCMCVIYIILYYTILYITCIYIYGEMHNRLKSNTDFYNDRMKKQEI